MHDFAAHLVFGYFTGPAPFTADRAKLAEMIEDLGDLKAASPVPTAGLLGVHPGLKTGDTAFAAKVKTFIAKWTAPSKGPLAAISFMGVRTPEPWIFFALKPAAGGTFVPAPQSAGRLARPDARFGGQILPRSTGVNTGTAGKIVSTAALFERHPAANLDEPAAAGLPQPLRKDIPDYVANPKFAHVFNTDCVSCHTETTRRELLSLSDHAGTFRYARPDGISGVNPAVVPRDDWNVRNFGWFRRDATITLRAANETPTRSPRFAGSPRRRAPPSSPSQAQLLRVSFRPEPRRAPAPPPPPPPSAEPAVPVATALTLVMEAKSPQDMQALRALIAGMQAKPPDQNPIRIALNELRIVHYARFVFLDDRPPRDHHHVRRHLRGLHRRLREHHRRRVQRADEARQGRAAAARAGQPRGLPGLRAGARQGRGAAVLQRVSRPDRRRDPDAPARGGREEGATAMNAPVGPAAPPSLRVIAALRDILVKP